MGRRKIHFESLREARTYFNSLTPYEQQRDNLHIYKKRKRKGSKPHYLVCSDMEYLHFYG